MKRPKGPLTHVFFLEGKVIILFLKNKKNINALIYLFQNL